MTLTLEDINRLSPEELIKAIQDAKDASKLEMYEAGRKQVDVLEHKVRSRPQKPTFQAVPGQFEDEERTKPKMEVAYVDVVKISSPWQKYIIEQRASFAIGNKITFRTDVPESKVFEAANATWRSTKMQYQCKEIAIRLMSETEVALIWYATRDESKPGGLKFRTRIISNDLGDSLFPVFDKYNDMIAFGRGYKIDDIEYFDLYTADKLRYFKNEDNGFVEYFLKTDESGQGLMVDLKYGKIPVIYASQARPECFDTQDLFDARELTFSEFADNNRYFGQPPLFLKQETEEGGVVMPAAGEPGKTLLGIGNTDAKFLTGGNTAGSRELEFEKIDKDIFTLNRAVPLDPESMKGAGDLSAAAMDRMLMAPHMAARDMQQGEFGRFIQRCINFLLAVYKEVLPAEQYDVEAEPIFTPFRIDDIAERIETAQKANGGLPVFTQYGSIEYIGDPYPEDTIEKIKEEAKERAANATPPTIPPVEED